MRGTGTLVESWIPGTWPDGLAVGHVDRPPRLVVLGVVDVIPGTDGEGERRASGRAGRPGSPRAPSRRRPGPSRSPVAGRTRPASPPPLRPVNPGHRNGQGTPPAPVTPHRHVDVGELRERDQRSAAPETAGTGYAADVLPDQVRLARTGNDQLVTAGPATPRTSARSHGLRLVILRKSGGRDLAAVALADLPMTPPETVSPHLGVSRSSDLFLNIVCELRSPVTESNRGPSPYPMDVWPSSGLQRPEQKTCLARCFWS
jgi:hypothetical protein